MVQLKLFIYILLLLSIFFLAQLMGAIGPYVIFPIIIIASLFFFRWDRLEVPWGKGLWQGVSAAVLIMSAIFILGLVSEAIVIKGISLNLAVIASSGVLQILGSTGEELSFRGYILGTMQKDMGFLRAAVISSALFSAFHIPVLFTSGISPIQGAIIGISIFTGGMVLALLLKGYGLKAAIGFHIGWNFIQYQVLGLRFDSGIIDTASKKLEMLFGGEFGPEAGLVSVFFLAAFLWYLKRFKVGTLE